MGKSRFVEPGVSNLFSFAPNHTVYLKLENLDVCQFSSFHSDWMLQDLIFLWRGKSRFVEPGVSNLFSFAPNHTVYLKLENLGVCRFSCQGYLFSMSTIHFATFTVPGLLVSMSTIHFATFTVTGFCRICQLYFSHLHQIILSTSNLRTLMSVSFHHFTVTGCCRI